jgi:hypothetical protein
MSLVIWPFQASTHQVLSQSVKQEIARRVAEKVYLEMRTGKYLEDAYIFEVAQVISEKAFDLELCHSENSNTIYFRIKDKP